MNYIDVIIFIIVMLGFIIGWKLRGILTVVIPAAFFAGIVASNYGYKPFSGLFVNFMADNGNRETLAYILIFLICSSILIFAGVALSRFLDFLSLAFIDRLFGAALLITVFAIPAFLLMDWLSHIQRFNLSADLHGSFLYPYMETYCEWFFKIPVLKDINIVQKILI